MKAHYHLVGIGGIGMGTLALLLLDQGYQVSGSDLKENFMTAQLRERGAHVSIGHCSENIMGADYVVYSSAIKLDNPEIQQARSCNIPVLKRAEVLARLMESKQGIAVAGAHGKTTTTSMLAHLFKTANLHPTVAVGGVVNNGGYSADTGTGDFFIAEVDESDGSFLCFSPRYAIITNIDFEHVDFYHDWQAIVQAYKTFIQKVPQDGCLVAFGDDANIQKLITQVPVKHIVYGFAKSNDIWVSDIQTQGFGCSFNCWHKKMLLGDIYLNIPGRHNVANALAVISLAQQLSMDFKIVQQSLSTFQGVQRRFTPRFHEHGVLIIEDYGHHPTEIRATLEAAQALDYQRVITVFQPHRYSRTKLLMQEFIDCFKKCDKLILTDIYAASEQPLEGINAQSLVEQINAKSPDLAQYLAMDQIVKHLEGFIRPGDLIIVLGAGDINSILKDLILQVKTHFNGHSDV